VESGKFKIESYNTTVATPSSRERGEGEVLEE